MKKTITTATLFLMGLVMMTGCNEQDSAAETDKESAEATETVAEKTKEAVETTKKVVSETAAVANEAFSKPVNAAADKTVEATEAVAETTKKVTETPVKETVEKAKEKAVEAVSVAEKAVEKTVEAAADKTKEAAAEVKEAVGKVDEDVEAAAPAKEEATDEKPAEAEPQAANTAEKSTEWPQWGGDGSNNMTTTTTNLPSDFTAGEIDGEGHVTGAKHAVWVVKLGSQAYGTPTIKDGRVFVGTNNEEPRIDGVKGDRGIVMCFDEKNGELLWQFAVPKLGAGKVSDWEFLGICSSVLVDGKHGYVVTNRGEIICLDVYGMTDGNDGPFKDEPKYATGGLEKLNEVDPVELGDKEGDIVWGYDMRSELGAFPHNITSSSVAMAGGKIFASTSNGVDWSHINIPAPSSPALIALNKETGELEGEEASGISERVMHCNWSSPAAGMINGKETVVFGAGDGWTYGYDANSFEEDEDGFKLMKELWKVDCCPKEYRFNDAGEPIKYATYPGPSEIISSPVIYEGKVYSAIGQDPEHGEGVGCITCIDPSKGTEEDAVVWQFKEIGRTISTPSIADGLLYIADYSGRLFCLDAETGELQWEHDTFSHIWGSTLVADGKVFLGNEDGELTILKHGREKEEINTISYPAPIYSTCVVANGVLHVMTQTHLYAYKL